MPKVSSTISAPLDHRSSSNDVGLEHHSLAPTAIFPQQLDRYVRNLRHDYVEANPEGEAPVATFSGAQMLAYLKVDLNSRSASPSQVQTAQELENYRRLPDSVKPFYYVSEKIAGNLPCSPSNEPLVSLGDVAKLRGVDIMIEPVETRFAGEILLRTSVAESLIEVAKSLQFATYGQITLKVVDGYRALEDQKRLFDACMDEFMRENPHASFEQVWEQVTQVVADPKLTPPHSTGGAIDVTLVYTNSQKELDMGCPVNDTREKAATWCCDLTPEQQYNRLLLVGAMTSGGFNNLATEFWHYSIGDPYHALYNNQERAIYSSIKEFSADIVARPIGPSPLPLDQYFFSKLRLNYGES